MMAGEGDGSVSAFPESIVERLWTVVDDIFTGEETARLCHGAETAQYRFLLLLAEVSEDKERVSELLAKLRGVDGGGDRSTMLRLLRDLNEATVPLYQRWLQQSAFTTVVYGRSEVGIRGMTRLILFRQYLLQASKRLLRRIKDGTVSAVAPNGVDDTTQWGEDVKNAMERVDSTVHSLLKRWMRNADGMELKELRWDTTPPSTLEMIIAAESVHPFDYPPLEMMRRRLQPTPPESHVRRHMYCFLHRESPTLPLIAVQVALWNGVASSVDDVLERPKVCSRTVEEAEERRDALDSAEATHNSAIFYSINNVQPGLRGVELGSTLIKTVVARLEQDSVTPHKINPALVHYSTLSPIPGFMTWFKATAIQLVDDSSRSPAATLWKEQSPLFGIVGEAMEGSLLPPLSLEQAEGIISELADALRAANVSHVPTDSRFFLKLIETLEGPVAGQEWWRNPEAARRFKRPMMRSICCYLTQMKKRSKAMDHVTNFHVGNGAELLRINWMANQTAKGNAESCCAMVNYYYDYGKLSDNALSYQATGSIPVGRPLERQVATM